MPYASSSRAPVKYDRSRETMRDTTGTVKFSTAFWKNQSPLTLTATYLLRVVRAAHSKDH